MGPGGIRPKFDAREEAAAAASSPMPSAGASKGGRGGAGDKKGGRVATKRKRESEMAATKPLSRAVSAQNVAQARGTPSAAAGAAQKVGRVAAIGEYDVVQGDLKSERLQQSMLGEVLTRAVRTVARGGRPTVKVVGETVSFDGGFPHRAKAVFVFQEYNLEGDELLIACLYLHEYGHECPAPNAGRVYVQSIDVCPLRGSVPCDSNQPLHDDTSSILRALLVSYFQFANKIGLQFCHLRVPPPTDSSTIFSHRPAEARVLAAACGVKWLQRQLRFAVRMRVVESFASDSGRVGLMTRCHAKEEDRWALEDVSRLDHAQAELLSQRHIVVKLRREASKDLLVRDNSPLMDRTFAVMR